MPKKKPADLKQTIEDQLVALFADQGEPSEGRMKLLKLGIGYLAVNAKLEEASFGEFFKPDDELGDAGGIPQRQNGEESVPRRRAKRTNGAAAAADPSEGSGTTGEGT